MLIESKIRRAAGTRVDFGTAVYHFLPDDLGRHVANVEDEGHLSRLLAISEGYRVAGPTSAAAAPIAAVATLPDIAPPEVVAAPPSAIPVVATVVDDESGADEDADGGDGDANAASAAFQPATQSLDDETAKQAQRDDLAAEYKALFGRKPAYNKTVDSMLRDIAERRAADAKAAG